MKHKWNLKNGTQMKYEWLLLLYGSMFLMILKGKGNLYGSTTDWINQHTVFPEVFRQAFYESGQLLPEFLFSIGGGQNIFHFAYYGFLSPFILLSYFLPFIDMAVYIMGVSVGCYLISAILVYRFFKHHFSEKKAFLAGILFLSLPPINYHFHRHIMFVWHLPFFLLALIGLDQYFERRLFLGFPVFPVFPKKGQLFTISVVCMILTSYFFSVSGIVFLFLYAIFWLIKKADTCRINNALLLDLVKLFFYPILLSAFFLLPTAYALLTNERSYSTEETIINLIVPLYEEYFYSSYSMGISAFFLFVILGNLTCKKKTKAECFLNVCSCLVLVCPLLLYMLNGMLYVRGKVLIAYSIILLYNVCQFLEHLEKKEVRLRITKLLSVGFVLFFVVLRKENQIIGMLLLIELGVLYLFKKWNKIWYMYPIVIACLTSCIVNKNETYVSPDVYKKLYDDEITELMEHTNGNFYRSNIMYQEMNTANKVYGKNFHSNSVYSSTSNRLYQNFYETYMGNNETYRNCFVVSGARNELFYTFMGTKYIIGKKDPGFYYEKVAQGEHLNLYENKYAYPIVYKSCQIMEETVFDKMEFPYSAEALMTHTIVSTNKKSQSFKEVNLQLTSNEVTCVHEQIKKTDSKCPLYYRTNHIKQLDVTNTYTFIQDKNESYTISLDETYKNKWLYLTFEIANEGAYHNTKDISITINGIKNKLTKDTSLYYNGNTKFDYVIPMEDNTNLKIEITKGKYAIQNLKLYTSEMIFTNYEEAEELKIDTYASQITCSVIAKQGEYLVTSIPYDKGFSAYINGEKVSVEIMNKAFVGIRLKEGKNNIVIKYHAPFLREGIFISMISFFVVTMNNRIQILAKVHKRKERK